MIKVNFPTHVTLYANHRYDVAILVVDRSGTYSETKFVTAAANLKNRLKDLEREYNSYYTYAKDKTRFYPIGKDQYNDLVSKVKARLYPDDLTPYLYNANGANESNMSNLMNMPVWLVWNMTSCRPERAFTEEGPCSRHAAELARMNPTTRYLILEPKSVAYQPINIKIDSVEDFTKAQSTQLIAAPESQPVE